MKVVLGVSGGVDSAVAGYLLKEKGYEVIGVTLYLFDYHMIDGSRKTPDYLNDGMAVCDQLGIEHVCLDVREAFENTVVKDFQENYVKGWLPNPCLVCNPSIKYQALLNYADEIGADFIATGHYSRIVKVEDRLTIERPKAEKKDQTYPLSGLTQDQLSRIIWPLADFESKDEIRALAKEIDLFVHEKKDSWGICFIEKGDFKGYLDYHFKNDNKGDFVNFEGEVLGKHLGTHHYTIGQKRNLGLDGKHTVLEIDGQSKNIVVGDDEACYHNVLYADDFKGMLWKEPMDEPVTIKICQWGYELPGRIVKAEGGVLEVHFDEPVRAITLGQRVVFYKEYKILASARIIARKLI